MRTTTFISDLAVNFVIVYTIPHIISCITSSTLIDLWPRNTYWSQFRVCVRISAFLKKSCHIVKKSGQPKEICVTCNATYFLRAVCQDVDLLDDPGVPKPRVFSLHRLHHFVDHLAIHFVEPTFAKGVPITKVRVLMTTLTAKQLIACNLSFFLFFSAI